MPAEEERSEPVTVLVLDARHRLWMPGSQTRARLWLRRQRAVLQPIAPLASRLKGRWGGRVAVRLSGSFRVGKAAGINAPSGRLLQRSDA